MSSNKRKYDQLTTTTTTTTSSSSSSSSIDILSCECKWQKKFTDHFTTNFKSRSNIFRLDNNHFRDNTIYFLNFYSLLLFIIKTYKKDEYNIIIIDVSHFDYLDEDYIEFRDYTKTILEYEYKNNQDVSFNKQQMKFSNNIELFFKTQKNSIYDYDYASRSSNRVYLRPETLVCQCIHSFIGQTFLSIITNDCIPIQDIAILIFEYLIVSSSINGITYFNR